MNTKSHRFRPIHFSTPEVRALLDGLKTQTRRVVKPQPTYVVPGVGTPCFIPEGKTGKEIRCPYNAPGDRLWVREAWAHDALSLADCRARREDAMHAARDILGHGPYYRADPVHEGSGLRWVSPLYMPRWASRITLEITDVRVRLLNDISDDDARAEGVSEGRVIGSAGSASTRGPVGEYVRLWDSTNSATPWTSNPWVWVLSFKRV